MTPTSPPRVAIVVLNWNRWRLTLGCLESLFRLDYPAFSVIVCDNASSDDSPAYLRAWARGEGRAAELPALPGVATAASRPLPSPISFRELTRAEAESGKPLDAVPLTLIHTGANLGFAGGCNVGLRHALSQGADYVWLLNNDTVVPVDSLSELIRHVQRHPDIAMCGSTVLHLDRPSRVLALGGGRVRLATGHVWNVGGDTPWPPASTTPPLPIDYVLGASMLVARGFLERAGLMDEGYFLYYEELDWAARLPPDLHLGYAPASVVYHAGGGTTGGLLLDHFYRSMVRFTWLHHRPLVPFVLARMALRVPEALGSRNWRQLRALIASFSSWSPPPRSSRSDH